MEREIFQLAPGDPIPPVTELMARYRMSQGTVVHALRHLRSKGIIVKPIGRKRLVAAEQKKPANTVLSILLLRPNWHSPDYDTMSHALHEEAGRQRIHLESFYYNSDSGQDLALALQSHDGVVILPSSSAGKPLFHLLEPSAVPAVALWEENSTAGIMSIADDDLEAGRMAARRLIELGHTKIAAFQSEPPVLGMNKRLEGWKEVLRNEGGIANPEAWLIDCSVLPGRDSIVGSYEKFRRWLFQNGNQFKATAVFCLCWTGALAMLRALREVGIEVPRDVSIIAHGGENYLCEFSNPSLTVVQGDAAKMASEAISYLKATCLGENPSKETVFIKPTLVERESTGQILSGKPLR